MAENGANTNRKWHLALIVVVIATLALLVPPLCSVWFFKAKQPLTILGGTEYVTLLCLVISSYFGSNVMQRHIETRNARLLMEEATNTPVIDEDDKDKEA